MSHGKAARNHTAGDARDARLEPRSPLRGGCATSWPRPCGRHPGSGVRYPGSGRASLAVADSVTVTDSDTVTESEHGHGSRPAGGANLWALGHIEP